MKKVVNAFMLIAAAAMLASSCNKYIVQYEWNKPKPQDPDDPTGEIVDKTFTASLEDSQFTKSDEISVIWGVSATSRNNVIPTEVGAKSKFTAKVVDTQKYFGSYPVTEYVAYLGGGALGMTVPGIQNGLIGFSKTYVAHTVNEEADFNFKNMTSALKFTLSREDVAQVIIRGTDGTKLAGLAKITFDSKKEPVYEQAESVADVKVVPSEGTVFKKGDYYVQLVPDLNLAEGLTFTCKGADGSTLVAPHKTEALTIARNTMANVGVVDESGGELHPDIFVTVSGAGKKNGENWENALGLAEFRTYINYDPQKSIEHAVAICDKTFRLAGGTYSIADETTKFCNISFAEYGSTVNFSIFGGYDPASTKDDLTKRDINTFETSFNGSLSSALVAVGAGTDVTFNGIVFERASGLAVQEDIEGKPEPRALTVYDAKAIAQVQDCYFRNNEENVNKGGAAILVSSGKAFVIDSKFVENVSKSQGGAVRVDGTQAYLCMKGCKFYNNRIGTSATYGTVMFARGNVGVHGCTFYGNNEQPNVNQPVINFNYNWIFSSNQLFGVSNFSTGTGLIRTETTGSYSGMLINNVFNNIYVGEQKAWGMLISKSDKKNYSAGHNVFCGKDGGISHTSRFDVDGSDVNTTAITGANYSFDEKTLEIKWAGTIEGHVEATNEQIVSAMNKFAPEQGDPEFGSMFCEWLVKIGALK